MTGIKILQKIDKLNKSPKNSNSLIEQLKEDDRQYFVSVAYAFFCRRNLDVNDLNYLGSRSMAKVTGVHLEYSILIDLEVKSIIAEYKELGIL